MSGFAAGEIGSEGERRDEERVTVCWKTVGWDTGLEKS